VRLYIPRTDRAFAAFRPEVCTSKLTSTLVFVYIPDMCSARPFWICAARPSPVQNPHTRYVPRVPQPHAKRYIRGMSSTHSQNQAPFDLVCVVAVLLIDYVGNFCLFLLVQIIDGPLSIFQEELMVDYVA